MSSTSTISVLLCARGNRELLPMVLECYRAQDYPNLELVAVIDGKDSTYDLVKDIPGVVAPYMEHSENLATKRNIGIRAAHGEIVVHFDSDDWSGPERISHQIVGLGENKVVGYSRAWWYDTRRKIAAYPSCGLWGAALCYDRLWALDHPWDETKWMCEDAWFLQSARDQNAAVELEGGDNFVALAHDGNAARPFGYQGWEIQPNENLPEGFRRGYVRD